MAVPEFFLNSKLKVIAKFKQSLCDSPKVKTLGVQSSGLN